MKIWQKLVDVSMTVVLQYEHTDRPGDDMKIKDAYDFDMLVNEMEGLVIEKLGELLDSPEYANVCRCQDCILDIAALALNHLRPTYRSSLSMKGLLYKPKLHTETYEMPLDKAVRDSIEKIRKNPSH